MSRFLTHVKHLREVEQSLPRLLERIAPLEQSGKLGPLLWQLPPNFSRDDDRLEAALAAFPRRLRHAVEFRHPSWCARADATVALAAAGDDGAPSCT